MEEIKVGLIGWGTVGDSVAGLLTRQAELIFQKTGVRVRLAKLADVDLEKPREHPMDPGILVQDYREILTDESIRIVVELVGGTTVARTILLEAMEKGKHVVTANKALLAEKGPEIFEMARRKEVSIGFEASVCGGIPLLHSIRRGLVGNRIHSVKGIVNGTTNFILSKMTQESWGYEDALREAQARGFAEMEPSLDVEGWDACHKLVLLVLLAFRRSVSMDSVPREGITEITPQDVSYAAELGYVVKLLAEAKQGEHGIEMGVFPTLVPNHHPLAAVDGAYNAVEVVGDWVGTTLFYGLGAGGAATSSAIVSDIVSVAARLSGKGGDDLSAPTWNEQEPALCPPNLCTSRFYLRFTGQDKPGVLGLLATFLGEEGISIGSVIQKEGGDVVPVVIMTHPAPAGSILKALRRIEALDVVKGKTAVLRALGD